MVEKLYSSINFPDPPKIDFAASYAEKIFNMWNFCKLEQLYILDY